MSDLEALGEALGHRFADPARLALALTHPSMVGLGITPATESYERLEFLGDRVLGLVVAEWLLERHPDEAEGTIARRHTALVRADALARVAEALDLGRYLRLAPGEEAGGGRRKPAILADACEAVIGALFLDGGLAPARAFVRRAWAALLEEGGSRPAHDPKTALQQWALGKGRPLPAYETLGRSGPDHAPQFEVRVTVAGAEPAVGAGGSKREAEKNAATALLAQLGVKA